MDNYPNISLFIRCFHSIQAKSFHVAEDNDDSLLHIKIFNASPQIKALLEHLFNEYKVIPALIEYFSKHVKDQGVLSAIEAFLACTSFIRIVLREQFDKRPLSIVAAERGGTKSLKADCEHEVACRYRFSPVWMEGIWDGSVMGQYSVPLWTYLAEGQGHQEVKCKLMEFRAPPALTTILKSDVASVNQSIITTITHQTIHVPTWVRNDAAVVLHEFLDITIVRDILPVDQELLMHYSLMQHMTEFLQEMHDIGPVDLARKVGMAETSVTYRAMMDFFQEFPTAISPAAWLHAQCESVLSPETDVFPLPMTAFIHCETRPTKKELPAVPAILWDMWDTKWMAVCQKLGIAWAPKPYHTFYYHGTSRKFAALILGKTGISVEKGLGCDFGRGYYLTEDFTHALQWVTKKFKKEHSVVIIYHVPDTLWAHESKAVDLSDYHSGKIQAKWENLVRQSNEDQDDFDSDYIRGLEAEFNGSINPNDPAWIPKRRNPLSLQTTLKTRRIARMLDGFQVGALVFPPSEPTTTITPATSPTVTTTTTTTTTTPTSLPTTTADTTPTSLPTTTSTTATSASTHPEPLQTTNQYKKKPRNNFTGQPN